MGARPGEHRSPATEFKARNGFALKYKTEFADEMIDYFRSCEMLPMFEEFATQKNVTTQTLRNWAKTYERFGAAYAICEEIQKTTLLRGGMSGAYNPQIVKFFAINNLGMSDKTEQKIDADVGGEFKVNITVLKPEKIS